MWLFDLSLPQIYLGVFSESPLDFEITSADYILTDNTAQLPRPGLSDTLHVI